MGGKPFDRQVINLLERAISLDTNEVGSYADLALREYVLNNYASRSSGGSDARTTQPTVGSAQFLGSGFRVRALGSPAMQVTLDPGLGFFNDNLSPTSLGGIGGIDDVSVLKPLSLTALETINVPAADPTNARIDIIEVQVDRRTTDATLRDVLNPVSGTFTPTSVNKTLTYNQNGRSTVNGEIGRASCRE